jgi:hypothetical protein
VGLRDRIKRLERATQEERTMEALKNSFMAAVKQLRAQADGEAPPPDSRMEHMVKDVEAGTRGAVSKVADLSEP